MQFLLSKDEYEALLTKPTADALKKEVEAGKTLRGALLEAHKVRCVRSHSEAPKGWRKAHYCDDCPVGKLVMEDKQPHSAICPDAGHWSQ